MSRGPIEPLRGTPWGGSWRRGGESAGGGITYDTLRLAGAIELDVQSSLVTVQGDEHIGSRAVRGSSDQGKQRLAP